MNEEYIYGWGRFPKKAETGYTGSWGHLPRRQHSQESGYSPRLKTLGGYSHVPEEQDREATPEDYRKNPFLVNLLESGETEEAEQKEIKQPQVNQNDRKFLNGTWYYRNPRDGKYYDIKGNLLR